MGPLMKLMQHKPSNPDTSEVLMSGMDGVSDPGRSRNKAIATLPLESSVEFNSYLSDVEVMISLKDSSFTMHLLS
jgi:hypothetical protein